MVAPISALANMEYALYGGVGLNSAAPNYLNGYRDSINMYDSLANSYAYMNPYMYNNSAYGANGVNGVNSSIYAQNNAGATSFGAVQNTNSKANEADMATLAKFYKNNAISPSESLANAAIGGGIVCGVMANPRIIAHPINTVKASFGDVKEMFKGVKVNGSDLNKLWKENHAVMEEAYFRMHKLSARSKGKLGLFRKRYTPDEYNKLKDIMQKALDSKDINKIAEASAKLEKAYVNNGGINRLLNKLKLKPEVPSVETALKDTAGIAEKAKTLVGSNKVTFKNALKKGGIWGSVIFAGLELLCGIDKIKTAFAKDKKSGRKQMMQTGVKAVGNAAGWALGEAAGVWAFASLGAKIGTVFGPGVGTAIGGVIGALCGSIGMWLAGKATRAIVGEDVADKIQAENMTKTQEGQAQLLTYTAQKVQEGKADKETALAFGRLASQYA